MKKNLFRFATALFFSTLFFALFNVSAESVKDSKYSVATAVELSKFLTAQSTTVSEDCDINSDGKINAIDLTLLKRYLIYGEPGTETTTTSTTSTTTNTTITTTTSSTTPTTTTKVGYGLIQQAIEEVSVKDTAIPKYKGEYYEATDGGSGTYTIGAATTVDEGSLVMGGIAIGSYAHVEGDRAMSIGRASGAYGKDSTAIGHYANALGEGSMAIGHGTVTGAEGITISRTDPDDPDYWRQDVDFVFTSMWGWTRLSHK